MSTMFTGLLHDFRRSAIRNMIRAGVSDKTAMQISGHATRSVFDRYDIGSDTDLQRTRSKIAKLDANWSQKPAKQNHQR